MSKVFLHQRYAESMIGHGYGYALYEPVSSDIMKPGYCGYLDESGQWNLLADLTDGPVLQANSLGPLEEVTPAPNSKRSWGPKISDSVKYHRVNLKANVSARAAGIPAEAVVQYTYSTTNDFGAILICSNPVMHERFYHKAPFSKWAKENARTILNRFPDAKKHGFFIVTATFSTSAASMNAWSNSKNEISIGFKASAVNAGEIAPSSGWYFAESSSGWVHSNPEGDERKVVFFGGIYFKCRKFFPTVVNEISQDKWSHFRSANEDSRFIVQDLDESYSYEFECIHLGNDDKNEAGESEDQDTDF